MSDVTKYKFLDSHSLCRFYFTRIKLEASLERRMKLAEDKIAQAEVQALKEVRIQAAEIAIAAAGKIIAGEFSKKDASSLVDANIKDLKKALN